MGATMAVQVASLMFAQGCLVRGTDCLGPEQVNQAFGHTLDLSAVAPLPFSEPDIVRARELRQQLILDVDKAPDGTVLTLEKLQKQLGNKMLGGKFLYYTDRYRKEAFFRTASQPTAWRLTTQEVIPGSAGCDYLGQTGLLVKYLREEVYRGQELPPAYQRAVEEFNDQKTELEKLVKSDWPEASKRLVALQVNRLFRETPLQVCYRIALHAGVNRGYLLPSMWSWTNARLSDGYIVAVGIADACGVGVDDGFPGYSRSRLGVCFSRSVVPEL